MKGREREWMNLAWDKNKHLSSMWTMVRTLEFFGDDDRLRATILLAHTHNHLNDSPFSSSWLISSGLVMLPFFCFVLFRCSWHDHWIIWLRLDAARWISCSSKLVRHHFVNLQMFCSILSNLKCSLFLTHKAHLTQSNHLKKRAKAWEYYNEPKR